jgi:hypothetical protein
MKFFYHMNGKIIIDNNNPLISGLLFICINGKIYRRLCIRLQLSFSSYALANQFHVPVDMAHGVSY